MKSKNKKVHADNNDCHRVIAIVTLTRWVWLKRGHFHHSYHKPCDFLMHCSFINHKQHLMYTGHIVTDWLVMLQATKRSSTQWGQFIAFIYKNLTCHCHHNWILHKCSWWGNIHRWTVSLALSIHLAPHVMAGLTEWCDVNSCDITCHGRPHRVMRREFMWHHMSCQASPSCATWIHVTSHVMPGFTKLCDVNSCDITCHDRPHSVVRRENLCSTTQPLNDM